MSTGLWTDECLDRMRDQADPPADRAIRAVFESADRQGVERLLGTLTRNDDLIPEHLPAAVQDYLKALPEIPAPEHDQIVEGQRLFADYGPEILMILACYALPASYAARKGVQVLHRTGFLAKRPNHRLFQTTQMVIDVMTPGGLGPKGRGRITAQKVRLMHAAIRYLILLDGNWSREDLGEPINQEDLAGTLMTFSWLILEGLRKLDIPIAREREAAYLTAWRAVGRIMGIEDSLIPTDVAQAAQLTAIVQRRQIAPSPEGIEMTDALVAMLKGRSPKGLKTIPSALIRHFLPQDVADSLGVPAHKVGGRMVAAAVPTARLLDFASGGQNRRRLFRHMGLLIVQTMVVVELGGRTDFRIPTELREAWRLSPRLRPLRAPRE